MMKRIAMTLVSAALLLMPVEASALLELDMGFDPAEVCPGEQVQFFFLLENVGGEAETVTMSVEFSFEEMTWGPFEGTFDLAAGEVISKEFQFMVPPPMPAGMLMITATATDSAGSVEAVAELEILDCGGRGKAMSPQSMIGQLRKQFGEIGVR